jgi:hypothetical protein
MSWIMSRSTPTMFPCGIPCSFALAISRSTAGATRLPDLRLPAGTDP